MQVAEITRGSWAIYDLVFLVSVSVTYVHTLPLQVLPSIPGYVPVYIRHGDQPLEEINPALAEAFHEGPSLSKSIDLDNISDPADISPIEADTFKYNVYPLHVRQANNHFSAKDESRKKSTEDIRETEAAKLASNPDKKNLQEKLKRKAASKPVVKVNPLTEEEKDALKKLRIDVRQSADSSIDMHDSSLRVFLLPEDKINRNGNEEILKQLVEADRTANHSIQSDPSSIKDASRPSVDEDAPTYTHTGEETPVKIQRLPNVLANVQKFLPTSETSLESEATQTEDRASTD